MPVNVTVEDLGPCKKLVRVELEAEAVNKAFDEVTGQYAKAARLPGFRPGKAPRAMVERSFGKEIEDDVKRKIIPDSYHEAMDSKKFRVIGAPDIEEIQFGRGRPLQFAATVEIEPDFTLPNYSGIPVKIPDKTVSPEDIEGALLLLRQRKGRTESVQRAIQEGDVAVVNYTGTCEGRPVSELAPAAQGLTEKREFWIEINPAAFIPGFGPQLVGRLPGDRQTVQVDFPADFVTPELAGKKGVYEVEIVDVKKRVIPELNEEFAKDYGAANLEALRDGVAKDLENDLRYRKNQDIRQQITRCLLGQVKCELPDNAVTRETRRLVYNIVEENRKRGISSEAIDAHKDDIFGAAKTTAEERVKVALILGQIAEKEGIKVERPELVARVQRIAAANGIPVERFVKQIEKNGGVVDIQEDILREKTMDFLVKNAKVEIVPWQPAPSASSPTPAA